MQNYRDPPPYPGHSKQHPPQHQQVFSNQPGYRQSYSGSETSTDVSLSSTENLSTSQRQDPQGEETRPVGFPGVDHISGSHTGAPSSFDGIGSGGYSILERLGMPPSVLVEGSGKFPFSGSGPQSSSSSSSGIGSSGTGSQQSPSSLTSSPSSYSAYVQERIQRQEDGFPAGSSSAYSTDHNGSYSTFSSSGYGTSIYPGGIHQQSSSTSFSPSSSSPLYSRGHLTVPQHRQSHRQLSNSSGRHESSISSNSSSSSTMTMISRDRGGGGGGVVGPSNFSSSVLSYSSLTNRSGNTNINNMPSEISSSATRVDSGGYTPRDVGNMSLLPSSSSASNLIPSSSAAPPHVSSSSSLSSHPHYQQNQYNVMSPRVPPVSTYHHPHPYVNQHWTMGSGDSNSSGSLSSLVTASSSTSSSRLDLLNSGAISNTNSSINSTMPAALGLPPPHPSSSGANIKASSSVSSLSHLPTYNPSTYGSAVPPPPQYPGQKTDDVVLSQRPYVPGVATFGVMSPRRDNLRPCKSYENMLNSDGQGLHGDNRPRGSHHDLRPRSSSPGIHVLNNNNNRVFSTPQRNMCPPPSVESNISASQTSITSNLQDSSSRLGSSSNVSQMVDVLTEQNRILRDELTTANAKVSRLHKLEQEIHKVHDSHSSLVQSSQKREALWNAMKSKLTERIHVLECQQRGTAPGGAGDLQSGVASSSPSDQDNRIKLSEKDAMISKLLSQNQSLSSIKDEYEASNAQLSLSLAEQRAHVDILENALLNAQSRILSLEDEKHKRSVNVEKVEQLQKALSSLQLVSEKQGQKEREMRARLEKELEGYRQLDKQMPRKSGEISKDDSKSAGMLRKMMDEKDARILKLETEMTAMEQKYLKETTLRQLSMESNTSETPKEVRLAALEKSSSDMERLIDEAKTEKLNHMEELHQSHRKVAELEARVKHLQTQVVEKEAMLKVFQRAPLTMARSSSLHALCHNSTHSTTNSSSIAHSPRPSLISSATTSGGNGWSSSIYGGGAGRSISATIRHMKTGSASAIELGRKMSMEEDVLSKVQGLRTESKSDTEEEVKLWHV